MSNKKHFKPAEFNQVKLLQKAGLSAAKVAKILDRSNSSIAYMFHCSTFKEYKGYAASKRKPITTAQEGATTDEVLSVPDRVKIADAIGILRELL